MLPGITLKIGGDEPGITDICGMFMISYAMNCAGWPSSVHTMDGVGAPVEIQEIVTDECTPSMIDTEPLLAAVWASTTQ